MGQWAAIGQKGLQRTQNYCAPSLRQKPLHPPPGCVLVFSRGDTLLSWYRRHLFFTSSHPDQQLVCACVIFVPRSGRYVTFPMHWVLHSQHLPSGCCCRMQHFHNINQHKTNSITNSGRNKTRYSDGLLEHHNRTDLARPYLRAESTILRLAASNGRVYIPLGPSTISSLSTAS